MKLAWLLVLAACGRVSFDAVPSDADDAPLIDAQQLATDIGLAGVGPDWARAVAARADGGFVVVGHIGGTRMLGSQPLAFAGLLDAVILWLDTSGAVERVRTFGGVEFETATGVASDDAGNIYVVGTIDGISDFGNGPVSSQLDDAYVVSFTASGAYRWSRLIGGNVAGGAMDAGFAVVLQGTNVIVGGAVAGTVDFGAGPTTGGTSGRDGFVAAYDRASGDYRWALRYGTSGSNTVFGVRATDDAIYIGGAFDDTTTFLGQPLAVQGGSGFTDALVAMLTPAGTLRWVRALGGPESDLARSIAIGPDGAAYAVGRLGGMLTVPSQMSVAARAQGFIARYTVDGTPEWVRVLGITAGCARFDTVTALADGDIVAGGIFSDRVVTTEATVVATSGGGDAILIGYSPAGEPRWAHQLGTATDDVFTGVAGPHRGALLASGSFASAIDTNCGGLSSGEEQDFVLRSF